MKISFDDFYKVLQNINAKITAKVSCPMNQNQLCYELYNNCPKGLVNDCRQRCKFFVNKYFYSIDVVFYGKNRKGFIESESVSVKNFVNKNQIDLKELTKKS